MQTQGCVAWRGSVAGLGLALILGCGCAQSPRPAAVTDRIPSAGTVTPQIAPEVIEGNAGTRLTLRHYVIHSTIVDQKVLARIGELLETALQSYRSVAPEIPPSTRLMECYLFQTRSQWAAYTRAHTGDDAAIYLRVNRGGYTIDERFVAYWIGDTGTYSVTAHEGWHQYVARHLKGRLPPFLEEGLACMFEQVQWISSGEKVDPIPRFDLTKNQPRLIALRAAVDGNYMYPLGKLVTMHAGQVVGQRSARIEAFYAQSWAFARFLNESHHEALRRMMMDASRGVLFADSSTDDPAGGPLWDPSTARPMIEHYLGMPLRDVEKEFAGWVREKVDAM